MPIDRRGLRLNIVSTRWSLYALFAAALLLSWEAVTRSGWISPWLLPAPAEVLLEFLSAVRSGEMVTHLYHSLRRISLGFLLGAAPGFLFGLLSGIPSVRTLTEPWLNALLVTPKITFIPYLMMMFGIGEAMFLSVISLVVFLHMTQAIVSGLFAIDQQLLDEVRLLGAGPLHLLEDVLLPSLLPYLLLGTQLGLQQAIRQTVLLEAVFSLQGIGFKLWSSSERLQMPAYFTYVVVMMALCVGTLGLLRGLVRISAPWFEHARRT